MFCTRCGTSVSQESKFCPSCGLDLSTVTPLATGQAPVEQSEEDIVRDALKDEYEIVKELGRGGMAIVFRAREKQLDREVAVKVLPFSLAFDAEFVERFQREARTAARLEHACIIPIYRVGRSGRVIYFVMKFLRGSSLSEVIAEKGAMPVPELKRMLKETAGALGYAHKNGIVHRDIKPDNIMFDESGHAVVTDFGIAKAGTGTRLTGTGMAIGTPHYMSPEQARAQKLDGRSDIYSLGVVAYQCLTGSVPFDGEDAFSIGYKHISEPVPVPPLKSAEHRQVFEVIKKMMAKAPEDRFQTAEEVMTTLEGKAAAIAAQPTVAMSAAETTVLPQGAVARRMATQPSTPTTPIPKTQPRAVPVKRKRSGALVGTFFMLVLLGGGGGVEAAGRRGGGDVRPHAGALSSRRACRPDRHRPDNPSGAIGAAAGGHRVPGRVRTDRGRHRGGDPGARAPHGGRGAQGRAQAYARRRLAAHRDHGARLREVHPDVGDRARVGYHDYGEHEAAGGPAGRRRPGGRGEAGGRLHQPRSHLQPERRLLRRASARHGGPAGAPGRADPG
ncbi:MAG: protein kinase [Gemmatimonadetes bacterium]|nr:protein kinase [Gemmatimonadota bacterium]